MEEDAAPSEEGRMMSQNNPAARLVLTIRDPQTGTLIAKDRVKPGEDEDAALLRIYRKSLGPDAPALRVLTKAIFPEEREWPDEIARKLKGFRLVILGPKDDARLEKGHFLLVRIAPAEPQDGLIFPLERGPLEEMKRGRRAEAVVPVDPDDPPLAGDIVTFRESAFDPFGTPVDVTDGASLSITLTRSEDQGRSFLGRRLYQIAWDPDEARRSGRKPAPQGAR